jgi:O-antigen/teichoic acid export membrane protein
MIPFRNLFRLFIGDFLAKTLYFLAFVYLARTLGVESYGTLEFALATITYFLVLADGGLELWATRTVAQGQDVRYLVGKVEPLRFLLAGGAFVILLVTLPLFPDYPGLDTLLLLFGLTLFTQAASLKWVFMGRERLSRVGSGLVISQVVFSLIVILLVQDPEDVIWVPILRLIGDLAMIIFFGWLFIQQFPGMWPKLSFLDAREVLRPALMMGASHGLAFMSYNFDTLLLGFMVGATAVGWYSAAYKPITAILAVPVTYFIGLFPTLSRTFNEGRHIFNTIVSRSLHLAVIFALPIGVGGMFLAADIIGFLFGDEYANSVLPLQILSWSAVFVILRGTYRQSLNAAGRQDLDLRCAGAAVALNVGLNVLLIPRFGIVGAAATTVASELLWLSMAMYYFYYRVARVSLFPMLWQPMLAALLMGVFLAFTQPLFWILQGLIAALLYFCVLLLLGENEVRSWMQAIRLETLARK